MTGTLTSGYTGRVPEHMVMAVPEPVFTESWHPISHSRLIRSLENAVAEVGMGVRSREYSVSENGLKMFGVWNLDRAEYGEHLKKDSKIGWCIGIRNSMDKSLAVGLVAGTNVFVCDNLAFSGDYIEFRKHTSGLSDATLTELCLRGVQKVQEKLFDFAKWHKELKAVHLEPDRAEHLTFEAMVGGVLAPSKFKALYGMYFAESGKYHDRSLFGWHGGITELMKGCSLLTISDKNKKLTALIDGFISEN